MRACEERIFLMEKGNARKQGRGHHASVVCPSVHAEQAGVVLLLLMLLYGLPFTCNPWPNRVLVQTEMHTPGIEPGSQAWGACMMPLHYVCSCL